MQRFDAQVLAYCQMGNHFHRVLHTRQGNLSRLMRHINGVHTQQFNRRHGLVGHLFQGRFKAILVDRDAYLIALCRYVERNPVAAGLVATVDEWAWSSDRAQVCMASTPSWLDSDRLHGCLLGRSVASERDRARAAQKYAALVTDADEGADESEASLWQTGLRQQVFPWRRRCRRSHAGAGVHRAAQRGLCSKGAAQVAQYGAGLPATNSGSARVAAHCIPGVRHHDDRDGQGGAAFCVAHQPTDCCGGSGRGWVEGKRQEARPDPLTLEAVEWVGGKMQDLTQYRSRSLRGDHFVARGFSVHETCLRQGVDLWKFMHAAMLASIANTVPPSLIPRPLAAVPTG